MKFLCLAFLALAYIELTTAQFSGGHWWSQFFGCGTVPTYGNRCHVGSKMTCIATASSTYSHGPYYGDYGAYLAVDGRLSPGNSGFYHSSLEPYPWLKIALVDPTQIATPKDVSRVEVYLRCDENTMYHGTSYEIRGTSDPSKPETQITPSPRLYGGKVCGIRGQVFYAANKITFPCENPITAAKEIWIQRLPGSHSHGAGRPNYNGNRWNSWTGKAPAQNSNWPVAFLMINEVVLY